LGGRHGDPERHEVAVGDINIAGDIRPTADVTHGESASEERVRGVGYLDLIEIRIGWVVEEGILLASRLIKSAINGS
jgi:hypothetical protein